MRDTSLLFFAVLFSLVGGIVTLWLTFQMIQTTGAELLAIAFGVLTGVFALGAIAAAVLGAVEIWDSD